MVVRDIKQDQISPILSMFRLNKKTEYALLALQTIALKDNSIVTVKEISEQHKVSYSLLAKVLQQLVRYGILKSVQGIKGGYKMNRTLETVTLAQVIEAIEGPIGITDCRIDKQKCKRINICTLKDNFDPIQKKIVQQLNNIKLLDFMNA